jgi:hypothetical protein
MKIMLCKLVILLPCSWAAEPNQTLTADQPMWQLFSSVDQLIMPKKQLTSDSTLLDQLNVPPYFVDQIKAVNLMLETFLVHKVMFLTKNIKWVFVLFSIMYNFSSLQLQSSIEIAFLPGSCIHN